MSDNWSVIRTDVQTFREYVKRLPAEANKQASYCYLLKKEEIERLLGLKGKGHTLDGLRIYLGGTMVDGHLIPNIHVVACEHDGELYNDFNVPARMPDATTAKPLAFAAAAPGSGDTATGGTFPCPVYCGKSNILNS